MTTFIRPRLKDTDAADIVCRTIVERAVEAWSFLARDLMKSANHVVAAPNCETAIKALIAAAFSGELGDVSGLFPPAQVKRLITLTEQTLNLGDPAREAEREVFAEAKRYSQAAMEALSQGNSASIAVSLRLLTQWFGEALEVFRMASGGAAEVVELDEDFLRSIGLVVSSLTGQWTRIASEYPLLAGGAPVRGVPHLDVTACTDTAYRTTEAIRPVQLRSGAAYCPLERATSPAIPGDIFYAKTAHLYAYSSLGVVLDGGTVAIASWRRTRLLPLSRVKMSKQIVLCRAPDPFVQQEISHHAKTHQSDWRRFRLVLAGLVMGNLEAMRTDQWPTAPQYSSQADFDAAWDRLEEMLECGDVIMTFDSSSALCRAIAALDSGPWSHSALHLGHGVLIEADTPGVGLCNIRRYRQRGIHLGVYRQLMPLTEAERHSFMMMALRHQRKHYNWTGALKAGVNALLDLPAFSYKTSHGSALHRTPNQGLYEGRLYLVAHA